eukprot:TRINITY_DN19896_c0_g2_i1.p1 TRINITY_DN19896_c0_g2~~TRINITY_DN19896_c0_g2_i1.p1  ORF type:complete len:521 (+),score=91.07 TRINITY_DN19896_c0_g2_i1:120-1682(+)
MAAVSAIEAEPVVDAINVTSGVVGHAVDAFACKSAGGGDNILDSAGISPLQMWADALHVIVLRHLGGSKQVSGYLAYSLLCRACYAAVDSPALWHELHLSEVSGQAAKSLVSRGQLRRMLRRCQGVVERLSLPPTLTDEAVTIVAEMLSGGPLRVLEFGGCTDESNGSTLPSLAVIPTLEELSIKCLWPLENEAVESVCLQCPNVCRLDVRHCGVSDMSVLLRRPGSWTSLHFDGCVGLNVAPLLAQPPGTWSALEELSLDGEDLDARQLRRIAEVCPRLRTLLVSFAREMDAPSLASLATLEHLEALTLRKAAKPTDADWGSFFHEQRLAGEAEPSLTGWRILSFAECELFADCAAAALASVAQPNLVEVDFSWCWHLTDVGLSGILAAAPSLQRIKLAGMKVLTAVGLANCLRLALLEELDCSACNTVADTMLEFLHRLFLGPPGSGGEALPAESLPPLVSRVASGLWRRRPRYSSSLRIKNYYAEYVQDWTQLRAQEDVCKSAEVFLANFDVLPCLD